MSRDRRLMFKRLDRLSDRIRRRIPGGAITMQVGLDDRVGKRDAARLLEHVRELQRMDDAKRAAAAKPGEAPRGRLPIVLIIGTLDPAKPLDAYQENAVAFLLLTLGEWCLEMHWPRLRNGRQRAVRNDDWRREGIVPEVEWSHLEADFFMDGGPMHIFGPEAWASLERRAHKIRGIRHVEEDIVRRHAEKGKAK